MFPCRLWKHHRPLPIPIFTLRIAHLPHLTDFLTRNILAGGNLNLLLLSIRPEEICSRVELELVNLKMSWICGRDRKLRRLLRWRGALEAG
jgi:hypothetical protein